jgi:hypothetical protein
MTMSKRISAVAFAALVATGAAVAAMSPPQWLEAQKGLAYPLYRPTRTVGLEQSSLARLPCVPGKTNWVSAQYGNAYKGTSFGKVRGFQIGEGYPEICANAGESRVVGTRTVGGVRVKVMVYCDPPKRCTLADGVKNGYALLWRKPFMPGQKLKKSTQIFMDSSRLTLAQLLAVASSLIPVS